MRVGVRKPARASAGVGMNWIKATRLAICYRNYHLHRPDIDITNMDDMRKSLSKLKKDFKHRLGGKKRVADRLGANAAGETTGSSLSPGRPDSRVATSGGDEEGGGISTGVSQAHLNDRPPKFMQAEEGRDNPQEREVDVDKKGASQSHSRLDLEVGGAGGSRPSREIKRASSPPFVDSVLPKLEDDSA